MDIEKLIEQLSARGLGNGTSLGYHSGLLDDAATALSTLQAENEKLRVEAEGMRSNWYKSVEEIKKLRAELEQVKAERDAAVDEVKHLKAVMRDEGIVVIPPKYPWERPEWNR